MHTGVSDRSEPCLLPANASLDDSRSWLPIWNVVQQVDEMLLPAQPLILILECGRLGANSMSCSDNKEFCLALEQVAKERYAKLNRPLAIIASSRDRMPTFSDWSRRCDPFTHVIARALHGEADYLEAGGNGDHLIDLDELTQFVSAELREWSLAHRGMARETWTWSGGVARPIALTWQLDGSLKTPQRAAALDSEVSQELQNVWQALETLHSQQPWQEYPAQWKELCRLAVAYEQCLFGGRRVTTQAASLAHTLKKQTNWLKAAIANQQRTQTISGQIRAREASIWRDFSTTPSREKALSLLSTSSDATSVEHSTVPLLSLLALESSNIIWNSPGLLGRYSESRAGSLVDLGPEVAQEPLIQDLRTNLRELELKIDDGILAGMAIEEIQELVTQHERNVEELLALGALFSSRQADLFEVLSESSDIGTHLLMAHVSSKDDFFTIENQLMRIAMMSEKNFELLSKVSTKAQLLSAQSSLPILNELRRLHSEAWTNLLRDRTAPTCANQLQLESLASGLWFPATGNQPGQIGKLRQKARERLSVWETQLDATTATETQEDTFAEDNAIEYSRLFASQVLGKLTSKSMSASEYRSWIQQVRTRDAVDFAGQPGPWQSSSIVPPAIEARLAAGLAGTRESANTILRLRNRAHEQDLLDFAEATLDGFWAVPKLANEPYFQWICREAISQAKLLQEEKPFEEPLQLLGQNSGVKLVSHPAPANELPASTLARCALLERKLQERTSAARDALSASSKWLPNLATDLAGSGASIDWVAQVTLTPNPSVSGLPAGLARVIFEDGKQLSGQPIFLERTMETKVVSLPVAWLGAESNANFSANAFVKFRGHAYSFSTDQYPSLGRRTSIRVPATSNSTLTIVDDHPVARRRTLILDCSASMFAPADPELGDAAEKSSAPSLSKLDAAKLALLTLLRDLRSREDQVSIVLYGHRVSQGSAEQGQLLQTKYMAGYPFPSDLHAYEDVEVVLPMGRFGAAEYAAVAKRLESVLPWGQTPLYLAINEAISAAVPLGELSPHDIVVISDGKNYQFNPTAEKRPTSDEVIRNAIEQKAKIHVIGFGVPQEEAEETAKTFEAIALATGGTATMQLANASMLSTQLQKLSSPNEYQVRFANAPTLVGAANEPLTLTGPMHDGETIGVAYKGNTYFVPLESGVDLQLQVSSNLNLICSRFTSDSPVFGRFIDAHDRPAPVEVGVHLPLQLNGKIDWKLSVQSTEGVVLRRPKEILVEIQPVSSDGDANTYRPYLIADPMWANHYNVPVIEFETLDWPQEADRARLSVWISDTSSTALNSIPIVADTVSTALPGGISLQLSKSSNRLTATLVGESGDAASDLIPRVVGERPQMVVRSLGESQDLCFHEFTFLQDDPTQRISLTALELHSVAAFKARALRLPLPLELAIAPSRLTLEPSRVENNLR